MQNREEDPDYEDIPKAPVGPDWVTGVLDEDTLKDMDLESVDFDDNISGRTSTPTDMEGLRGGVDKGDGWVTFKLDGEDEVLGIDGEEGEEDDDEDDMDQRLR